MSKGYKVVGRVTPCAPSAARVRTGGGQRTARPTELRREFRAWRGSLPAGLERDTLLMPRVIAESVCDEVSRFLDVELPARYVVWLAAKAERCYAGRKRFYRTMGGRGNAPRDWLCVFMRHWLASLLKLERPDLYRCLPPEFDLGRRLPVGMHSRINRRGVVPHHLYGSCRWNPEAVLRNHRWNWLLLVS